MADPKDKKPDETGDIPLFKIGEDGEIAPAPRENTGLRDDDFAPVEPVFSSGLELDLSSPISQAAIELEPSLEHSKTSKLDDALDKLRPQIESIARANTDAVSDAQVDILKRYVSLKESETRDLKEQLRQYLAVSKKQTNEIHGLQSKLRSALEQATTSREREERLRIEYSQAKEKHQNEVEALRAGFEDRMLHGNQVAADAAALERKREEWKEKVREDLKRIKLKERELENKYELLKRDTQALLDSKDRHVLELKKKSDALELELESLEDRLRRSNQVLQGIESKKKRLLETMKLASTLLDKIDQTDGPEALIINDRKKDGTSG